MGLLILLHLISANVYGSIEAPQSRGFSYIESWILGIQGLIMLAIIEYTAILGWKKYSKYKNSVASKAVNNAISERPKSDEGRPSPKYAWFGNHPTTEVETAFIIDMLAFSFSIVLFLCFNLHYWFLS